MTEVSRWIQKAEPDAPPDCVPTSKTAGRPRLTGRLPTNRAAVDEHVPRLLRERPSLGMLGPTPRLLAGGEMSCCLTWHYHPSPAFTGSCANVVDVTAPGTWDERTGAPVVWGEALDAWIGAAEPVLRSTAEVYGAVITYAELGQAVQDRTGIRTRSLLMNWIGQVLEGVALSCEQHGELLLTSLCVHQDGTVGAGYAGAVARHGGGAPDDAEMHAAEERLACYRKYAHNLPTDGGRPQLTHQEAARRQPPRTPSVEKVCPVHFTALPMSGVCDYCD